MRLASTDEHRTARAVAERPRGSHRESNADGSVAGTRPSVGPDAGATR